MLKKIKNILLVLGGLLLVLLLNDRKVYGAKTGVDQFPASYQEALQELQDAHPNWIFEPLKTNLSFSKAVSMEFNKNVITKDANSFYKSNLPGDYVNGSYVFKDANKWVRASENATAYFMDPRNWLNEENIFQFETIEFNSKRQTVEGVEEILSDTFMYKKKIRYYNTKGKRVKTKKTYAQVIYNAGKKSGVSPYYLASKIRQEIGTEGSGSSSGKTKGYKGYYNFYNIGASDGANPVANGLSYAKQKGSYCRPWNSPMRAILGGAYYIADEYLSGGQPCGYLMKFNVNKKSSWGLYSHQYMTNVGGCCQESITTYQAYENMGSLNKEKRFLIPVYRDMPDEESTVEIGGGKNTGITSTASRIKKGPNTDSATICRIKKNTQVTIIGCGQYQDFYQFKNLDHPYWFKVSFTRAGENVTGYIEAEYVTIDSSMTIGKNQSIKPDTSLSATTAGKVYYQSSNPEVATVSSNGRISTVGDGKVTIYAFLANGNFDALSITVKGEGIIKVNQSSLSLIMGKTSRLEAKLTKTEDESKIYWSSDDESIATVDKDGVVTGIAVGSTVISARAANGVESSCSVTVRPGSVGKIQVLDRTYGHSVLKWNVATGASGYEVYRKGGEDDRYVRIALVRGHNKTKYVDKKAEPGVVYRYKIRGYRVSDRVRYYSVDRFKSLRPKISKVKVKKLIRKTSYAKITWERDPYVDGYLVYRRTKNGQYKEIKRVTRSRITYYVDRTIKKNAIYYYKVAAYNKINGEIVKGNYSKSIRLD